MGSAESDASEISSTSTNRIIVIDDAGGLLKTWHQWVSEAIGRVPSQEEFVARIDAASGKAAILEGASSDTTGLIVSDYSMPVIGTKKKSPTGVEMIRDVYKEAQSDPRIRRHLGSTIKVINSSYIHHVVDQTDLELLRKQLELGHFNLVFNKGFSYQIGSDLITAALSSPAVRRAINIVPILNTNPAHEGRLLKGIEDPEVRALVHRIRSSSRAQFSDRDWVRYLVDDSERAAFEKVDIAAEKTLKSA